MTLPNTRAPRQLQLDLRIASAEDIMRSDVLRAVYELDITIQQIDGDWIATHYR